MPKRERINRVGLADPRTGRERIAGLVNKAVSGSRKQARRYDDDDATRARNIHDSDTKSKTRSVAKKATKRASTTRRGK